MIKIFVSSNSRFLFWQICEIMKGNRPRGQKDCSRYCTEIHHTKFLFLSRQVGKDIGTAELIRAWFEILNTSWHQVFESPMCWLSVKIMILSEFYNLNNFSRKLAFVERMEMFFVEIAFFRECLFWYVFLCCTLQSIALDIGSKLNV